MDAIPYVFYSYSIIDPATDEVLHPSKHMSLFKSVHKTPVAYRKFDPSEADKDTQLVVLKERKSEGLRVISFYVSRRISERKISIYHKIKDEFEEGVEGTSDHARALFVAIPDFGKIAVMDKSGEHNINSDSAVNRLKRIIYDVAERKLITEYAASAEEVRRAFDVWTIDQVNFSARPYNPHPSTPGDRLSELMADNSSRLTGTIKPQKEHLNNIKEGFIGELLGLSERGYAEIGAKGRTPSGHAAHLAKRNLKDDLNEPARIRVMFPERADPEAHVSDIIEAMRQLYEKKP